MDINRKSKKQFHKRIKNEWRLVMSARTDAITSFRVRLCSSLLVSPEQFESSADILIRRYTQDRRKHHPFIMNMSYRSANYSFN